MRRGAGRRGCGAGVASVSVRPRGDPGARANWLGSRVRRGCGVGPGTAPRHRRRFRPGGAVLGLRLGDGVSRDGASVGGRL